LTEQDEVAPHPSPAESSAPTVVGIGTSAGGIAALKNLFAGIPADSGLAFVVVMHLAPDRESHLASILQPSVKVPVEQVAATVRLEPNRVYLIPPNANLDAIDTHLRLSELESVRTQRAPVDHFFRTLAQTHDGHSVGIILSGTGSDGTLGVKAIKEKGGLTVVQTPDEAEYDGMPRSAIATGLVDLVLPVREIPEAVLRFAYTQPRVAVSDDDRVANEVQELIHSIFGQIRARTGRDFTRYKRSTVLRRIARRMRLHQVEELPAYLDLVRANPDEANALADDLLITVTNFFRDPDVFEKLADEILPKIFARKGPHDGDVRIWVVGCATGEEAYSLAILLLEESSRHDAPPRIQVFASDLHEHSLERARQGFYPGDIEAEVHPERLRRFFSKEMGGYRVRKEVRELVVFAPHNLLRDPPFSRIDLISCRNLLIYLQRDAQREVDELFHYALRPEGFLLLGGSEGITRPDLFLAEGKKTSLFRKRDVPTPEPRLPVFPLWRNQIRDRDAVAAAGPQPSYGRLHQQLVEQLAQPSVLVGPDDKVVHLSERAGRYLLHPGGEPTASIFKLVRKELQLDLHAALAEARRGRTTRTSAIRVRFDGEEHPVMMHVLPQPDPIESGLVLVIFDERNYGEEGDSDVELAPEGASARVSVRDLEAELDYLRQKLQAMIEEYETSQEEMRASNEELQSANEELRSTMEELETGKEELHSMNEELQTVNQENRHKVEELSQLSSDLQNLLSSTDIATLFLDRDLRIMRFTPKVGELFNVRASDRGRPLSDLTHRLGYTELQDDASAVLTRLIPIEREVRDEQGRWYLMRLLPYRSTTDRIDGTVITFVETTAMKRVEEALRASEERVSEELAAMVQLHELVGRLLLSPDLDTALTEILAASMSITRADKGVAHIVDPSGKLQVAAQRGFAPELVEQLGSLRSGEPAARAHESGVRVGVEDVLADPAYAANRELARAAGYRGVQATPLVSRLREPLGILTTYYTNPYQPSKRDLRVLDLYARQAAEFIERVRSAGMLSEKTRELQEEDERKGFFLATLGHELRNPLAVLDNALHALQLTEPGRRAERFENELLPMVSTQVNQLKRLVDDLLEVSRITRGTITLSKARVDLVAILRAAIEAHAEDVRERAQIVTVSAPDTLWVHGDELRLLQIVSNLISNASKYSAKRGRVEVRLHEAAGSAVLVVRDHGRGIEARNLSRIFEPFVQTDPGTGGLGIGLPLVKRLVELHGGSVTAESPGAGQGSTFTVRLPIGDPTGARPVAKDADLKQLPEGIRMLIIEDGRDNADSLAILLRAQGAEVRCAYSGAEGLEQAHRWMPAVILIDIGLPYMSGFEVARRIAQQNHRALLVATTGFSDPDTERRAKDAGFAVRLVKPIDLDQLYALITQHVAAEAPIS
jgi:two-component system CheB/CheR fusion protein